ncbi:hypothetical protein LCGC14_1054370 [marine sediment metagenome]|uniref:Uncharacterized protein n=1 Tax=marine sediment metagenome TaxID=412755 RepID=A0A0F9N9Q9_9ZZZZ
MAAGDISDGMVARLGIRLEDEEENTYVEAMKLTALNSAQLYVARIINKAYISELEVLDTARAQTANALAYSALDGGSSTLLGNSDDYIISVQDNSSSKYLSKTTIEELKALENSDIAGGATNMLWYAFDEKVNTITGGGATDSIIVVFFETPATMTTSVDPVLGKGLYDLIVTLAEAELWTQSEELQRHVVAWESAMRQIKILNNKYTPPVEVGPGR